MFLHTQKLKKFMINMVLSSENILKQSYRCKLCGVNFEDTVPKWIMTKKVCAKCFYKIRNSQKLCEELNKKWIKTKQNK